MSKKQQERKKKLRKEIAKKRVLARRSALRRQASEELQKSRLDRKFRKKMDPIVKDEEKKKILDDAKDAKIVSKLEKNLEILKALEEEYLSEIDRKKEINKRLEEEGHVTLTEKMNALDQKARETMTEEQLETGMVDLEKKD